MITDVATIKTILRIENPTETVTAEPIQLNGTTAAALANKNYYDDNVVNNIVVKSSAGEIYELLTDYTIGQDAEFKTTITRKSTGGIADGEVVKVDYNYIGQSDDDELIQEAIENAQAAIIEFCNNNFAEINYNSLSQDITERQTIAFTSPNTITDSAALFNFEAGDNIYIEGTKYNDGHYTIATASNDTLTVSEGGFRTEAAGEYVSIYYVRYPKTLKGVVANIVNEKIQGRAVGITSESVAGVSTSYANDGGAVLSDSIKSSLTAWRIPKFLH